MNLRQYFSLCFSIFLSFQTSLSLLLSLFISITVGVIHSFSSHIPIHTRRHSLIMREKIMRRNYCSLIAQWWEILRYFPIIGRDYLTTSPDLLYNRNEGALVINSLKSDELCSRMQLEVKWKEQKWNSSQFSISVPSFSVELDVFFEGKLESPLRTS